MNTEELKQFLQQGDEERYDSAAVQHVQRELELVKSRTYDVRYKPLKARQFIPASEDRDPAAEYITYYQWDEFGTAKIVTNYADDFPFVDALRNEFSTPVKSIGAAYQFTLQDLRRSAKAGTGLEQRRANAARMAIERKIDEMAAFGDSTSGITGFANHPNVPVVALPNGGAWKSGAALVTEILQDLHAFVAATVDAGGDVFVPNVLILPTTAYHHLSQTFMSVDNTKSILRAFLEENPYIEQVDHWNKLDNVAGATGSNRMICYQRSPEVVTLEEPQPFEQFPPQQQGLTWRVYCHARFGGAVVRYPVAMRYADNVN